jgi:hypothetical protein
MAQSSAFIGGETFVSESCITFDSLDFLPTATGELCLADTNAFAAMGARHALPPPEVRQKINASRGVPPPLIGALTGSQIDANRVFGFGTNF